MMNKNNVMVAVAFLVVLQVCVTSAMPWSPSASASSHAVAYGSPSHAVAYSAASAASAARPVRPVVTVGYVQTGYVSGGSRYDNSYERYDNDNSHEVGVVYSVRPQRYGVW